MFLCYSGQESSVGLQEGIGSASYKKGQGTDRELQSLFGTANACRVFTVSSQTEFDLSADKTEDLSLDALAARFERRDGDSLLPVYSPNTANSAFARSGGDTEGVAFLTNLLVEHGGTFPMSKIGKLLNQNPTLKARVGKIRHFIEFKHPDLFRLDKQQGRWLVTLIPQSGGKGGSSLAGTGVAFHWVLGSII